MDSILLNNIIIPFELKGDIEDFKNVKISGVIKKLEDEHLDIECNVELSYKTECARCLTEIQPLIEFKIKDIIYNGNKKDLEEDSYHYSQNSVDITNIIRDNIVFNLDMKYLCSENCTGICIHCGGINCGCNIKDIDPRLEILKTIGGV